MFCTVLYCIVLYCICIVDDARPTPRHLNAQRWTSKCPKPNARRRERGPSLRHTHTRRNRYRAGVRTGTRQNGHCEQIPQDIAHGATRRRHGASQRDPLTSSALCVFRVTLSHGDPMKPVDLTASAIPSAGLAVVSLWRPRYLHVNDESSTLPPRCVCTLTRCGSFPTVPNVGGQLRQQHRDSRRTLSCLQRQRAGGLQATRGYRRGERGKGACIRGDLWRLARASVRPPPFSSVGEHPPSTL